MYYEYKICYVDDMLCISDYLLCTMKDIHDRFKMKGCKIEEPAMYIGTELSNMTNIDG